MLKSIFQVNAAEGEREVELRRMNEAFRECREAWRARLGAPPVAEKTADNVVRIGPVNRNREG